MKISTKLRKNALAGVGLASVMIATSASAQSTWTGAVDSNYGTAGNWDPSASAPNHSVDVIIHSAPNAPVNSGNLDRRGSGTTTIDQGGNLTVNGRFLQGGAGAFNVLDGSLTVNGEYFLVGGDAQGGTNGPSTFNQSGGAVTANLLRSFHLSDNSLATSGTVYNLTGGTLVVKSSTSGAVSEELRGVWLGKGGTGAGTMVGDRFHVNGGAATFIRTGTLEGNVRISRNSELKVSSGSIDFDNYSNFWVGAGNAGSTTSRIVIDGGAMHITGTTNLYLGREDDGQLTINSGSLTIEGFIFLGGDGTGDMDGIGTITMTGGSLSAGALLAFNEGSHFNFEGGTLTLKGNQTGIVGETWFVGDAFASYDSLNDLTTITAIPEPGTIALVAIGLFGILALRRRKAVAC